MRIPSGRKVASSKAEAAGTAPAHNGREQGLIRQLEAERARLVAAQAVARVGSWETDLATFAVTWSAETYRIFEADPAWQPTHAGFLGAVHPDDRAAVAAAFDRSAGLTGAQSIEHRLLMPDGRVKFVEERWQAFFDDQGQPLRAVGTCQDISTKRFAEGAIRLQAHLLDSIGQAVVATDVDGQVTYANRFAEKLYGWEPGQMLGRSIFDVTVSEASLGQAAEIMERLRRGQSWSGDFLVRRRDGTVFPASVVNSPILDEQGNLSGIIGISSDATERNATERALQASVDEFRNLADAMPQIVWVTRPDGWNTWVNQEFTSYAGLTLEQSLGEGWTHVFHPEDQPRAWAAWQDALATGRDHIVECRLRRYDGAYRWWLIRGQPLRDASGTILKWIGTCTDIHDLKVAQEELTLAVATLQSTERRLIASEEEYRPLFDSNPHAMWVFDFETLEFLAVNDAAIALYGYSRDEFLHMTIMDIRPPGEVPALLEYLAVMPDAAGLVATQVRHRKKDGSSLEVEGATSPIQFHGRRARLVLAKDVSEKKLLESQLLQAQKMEAVGRLAGGVAHDFNNALGVILGYTELLLRQCDEKQKGKLEQIRKATERASGLTRQLLAFSRKQVVDPKVLDLNILLSDLETMLGRLIGEDIDLAMIPGDGLGQVKADAGQLEQVVMNLCINARDAMPDGGLLRIETSNVDLDAVHAACLESMTPGRYVMMAVSDSGCGIPADALSQIFEPFFTTKEEGKGTGLGLAMVYGIAKQSGGHVTVSSAVGEGTTFGVYLPRIDEPVTAAVVDAAPMPDRGWETILLVEDEEALRAITQEILSEHGYRVLEASGADQALAIARSHPEPIHLVLTDVVMPGTNGRVLAEALAGARPGIKVLFMSGYTDDVIAHRGVLESGTLLLDKPFTVLALLRHVRAALGTAARRFDV